MKDTKHIRWNFICRLGHAPGVGLWDTGVTHAGGQTILFFKHDHVAYQTDGDGEQNKMQVTFSF